MDPSRNHRVLRAYQSKLQPPVIPFVPLFVKGEYINTREISSSHVYHGRVYTQNYYALYTVVSLVWIRCGFEVICIFLLSPRCIFPS